jgi:hypothetical protein
MDFGLAFTFPFKDPDWFKKIIILGLVGLIPIIGQLVVLGWAFEIARRVIRGDYQPLPELDFGEQLGKGFQVWLIALVYAIPIILATIPLAIADSLAANAGGDAQNIVAILSVCCSAVIFLYGLFLGFVLPAAIGRFADKGNLGAAFQFGEVFGLVRNNPVAYLLVLLGYVVAGFIAPAGSILCIIGVILTAVYSQAIIYHLTGQAYRQSVR